MAAALQLRLVLRRPGGALVELWTPPVGFATCPLCSQGYGSYRLFPTDDTLHSGQSKLVHIGCSDRVLDLLDRWAVDDYSPNILRVGRAQFRHRDGT